MSSVPGYAAAAALLVTLGCGGSTASTPIATFVAVGADSTILTSADGETWTAHWGLSRADLRSVATGAGLFVAVGQDGKILSSADGASWTERRTAAVDLSHVIYTGDEFIAVGGDWSSDATTFRSSNGIAWAELESPSEYSFQAVATARSTVVVAAVKPSKITPMALDNVVLASVPPTTSNRGGWVERNLPRFTDSISLDTEAITVGSWGGISSLSRTSDGEHWTTQDVPILDASSIATDGTRLVIVGASNSITTEDGSAWSAPIELGAVWLAAVGFGAGQFVAVGSGGALLTSPDGLDWTGQDTGTRADLLDVAFGPAP